MRFFYKIFRGVGYGFCVAGALIGILMLVVGEDSFRENYSQGGILIMNVSILLSVIISLCLDTEVGAPRQPIQYSTHPIQQAPMEKDPMEQSIIEMLENYGKGTTREEIKYNRAKEDRLWRQLERDYWNAFREQINIKTSNDYEIYKDRLERRGHMGRI